MAESRAFPRRLVQVCFPHDPPRNGSLWFSGTLCGGTFHLLKPFGVAFTGLFFGGPILIPLATTIATLFVALVHFGRAEEGEEVRPRRLLTGFGVYATLNIGLASAIIWRE